MTSREVDRGVRVSKKTNIRHFGVGHQPDSKTGVITSADLLCPRGSSTACLVQVDFGKGTETVHLNKLQVIAATVNVA